jgi:hypothetical protein
MNTRAAAFVVLLLASCGPKAPADEAAGGRLAELGAGGSGGEGGAGGGVDVSRAIDDAKTALAALDDRLAKARDALAADTTDIADHDLAAVALAHDRTALASYLDDLQRCGADAAYCPTKLEEPAIPADYDAAHGELTSDFTADASKWPAAATALGDDACACRSYDCAMWILATLDRWEGVLSPRELDDDTAAAGETRARSCVHRRLGSR